MNNDFNFNNESNNLGGNIFKKAEDKKNKKLTKKELANELKQKKKVLEEEFKEKEINRNERTDYLKICIELMDVEKKIYLENFKRRKDALEKKYYKAFAIESGVDFKNENK